MTLGPITLSSVPTACLRRCYIHQSRRRIARRIEEEWIILFEILTSEDVMAS